MRAHSRAALARVLVVAAMSLSCAPALAQSFIKGSLVGATPDAPTAIQFGPDGRLYVTERYGLIRIYTVSRSGPGSYNATAEETIGTVQSTTNHNDDGTVNGSQNTRQTTGMFVAGTAQNPVVYVTNSDPRVAVGSDSGLDTNSGILTRLTWNGATWDRLDLVRGLPRNEENHSTNGLFLDEATNTMYIAQGGHTNMGAPSNNFAFQKEYALSAAILSVDLNAIGESTYELPTLDDPSRTNETRLFNGVMQTVDVNDPFGGNNGENQAIIVPGGPVQVFAPGFRNAYDVWVTADGRMYTIDNGPNSGWGGPPINCTLTNNDNDSRSYNDALHYIGDTDTYVPGSYYGGHPNTTRADRNNTFAGGQSPIPVGMENPVECVYGMPFGSGNPPPAPHNLPDTSLWSWNSSTNGLCEYTASNFGGTMQGDLLTALYNGQSIDRIQLNGTGDDITTVSTLFPNVGGNQLDVTAQSDVDVYPGTIWTAGFAQDKIFVFEPDDFSVCTGVYDAGLDEDNDGYSNADEIDNGTDPCSNGSVPSDNDGDFLSDLNDNDDDNDGVLDVIDEFAIDAFNGTTTALPIAYEWGVGEPGFGILGLGFTGLMTNGVDDYKSQFDPANATPGGAAGVFTMDVVTEGDAYQAGNDQDNGFQFGVNVSTATGVFEVSTAVRSPFFGGVTPQDFQSHGLHIGAGDQDNYMKLVMSANGGVGGVQVLIEDAGSASETTYGPGVIGGDVLAETSVELVLTVDPAAGTVQPSVALGGGSRVDLGSPLTLSGQTLQRVQGPQALAVGLISTSLGAGPEFAASWDYLRVTPIASSTSALVRIDPGGNGIDGSTYGNGSFQISNTSTGGELITAVEIDLGTAVFPDMVFDPDGTAGDLTAKGFTINSAGNTGAIGHGFASPHNGVDGDDGYDVLNITYTEFDPGETMTFSIDNDPTSIKQTGAPGPNEAGSVSGAELTGATVRVTFSDGTTHLGETFFDGATIDASEAVVTSAPLPAPIVEAVGIGLGSAQVIGASQTIRVAGPAGAGGTLFHAEGGMFLAGMAGPFPNGYDVDPFETNSVTSVTAIPFTVGAGGTVDVTVTLTRFEGDGGYTPGGNDILGLNTFAAVIDDGAGRNGLVSDQIVLQLVAADMTASTETLAFGGVTVGEIAATPLTLTNTTGSPIDVTGLSLVGDPPFGLQSPPALPATIPGGGTLDLTVRFAPESLGAESGSLTVTHDGVSSPLVVALSGTGVFSSGDVLFRVNTGGAQVNTIDGGPNWSADTSGTPSSNLVSTGQNTAGFTVNPGPTVPLSTPAAVFQTERWDPSADPEMQWEFGVGADETVEVRLYVGNGYSGTSNPGTRVYNVEIEGADPFGAIDLAADFGHQVGAMLSHVTTVGPDGTLDIDFFHQVENPLINAIEILGVDDGFTLAADSALVPIAVDSGTPLGSGQNTVDASDAQTYALSLSAVDDTTGVAPTWLTLPTSPETGTPFDLDVDASASPTGVYSATVTATATGADPIAFTVEMTVNGGVNAAPVANDDNANALDGVATDIVVLANDTDDGFPADPALVSVAVATGPAEGTAVVNPDNTVRYTYTGPTLVADTVDSFTYTVTDAGALQSSEATVTVTVSPYTSDASVVLTVNDGDPISASPSSYTANAFQLTNTSPTQNLTFVEIDLSSAAMIDLVFDPDGKAGDAVGKGLDVNTDPGIGSIAGSFLGFNNGVDDDDGFNVMRIDFTGFAPGMTLGFSTDVDPNSIKGYTGSGLAGSAMGLEMVGATVRAGFDDGAVVVGTLHGGGLDGSASADLALDQPPAPTLEMLGGFGLDRINVANPSQTFRVHAPEGSTVRLLRFEAILSPQGINGGLGYEVELFEANTIPASGPTSQQSGVVGPSGFVEFAEFIQSSAVAPDEEPGYNHLVAVIDDGTRFGPSSNAMIVKIGTNLPPVAGDDDATVRGGLSVAIDVTADDVDLDGAIDPTTVLVTGGPASGSITGIDQVTGAVTYLAPLTGAVADAFTYTVEDNAGALSNEATVSIDIGCAVDLNDDGVVDNGDIQVFIGLFLAGDPGVDLNGDGLLDNGDIAAFVDLFIAGC